MGRPGLHVLTSLPPLPATTRTGMRLPATRAARQRSSPPFAVRCGRRRVGASSTAARYAGPGTSPDRERLAASDAVDPAEQTGCA